MGWVGFAERDAWKVGERPGHPGLMFAAWITLPHFSVSSAMSLPKSAGEPLRPGPPPSASRAFFFGAERAALISLWSLSTISAGVFAGAPRPYHVLASKPGTKSPTGGRPGNASER